MKVSIKLSGRKYSFQDGWTWCHKAYPFARDAIRAASAERKFKGGGIAAKAAALLGTRLSEEDEPWKVFVLHGVEIDAADLQHGSPLHPGSGGIDREFLVKGLRGI